MYRIRIQVSKMRNYYSESERMKSRSEKLNKSQKKLNREKKFKKMRNYVSYITIREGYFGQGGLFWTPHCSVNNSRTEEWWYLFSVSFESTIIQDLQNDIKNECFRSSVLELLTEQCGVQNSPPLRYTNYFEKMKSEKKRVWDSRNYF